MIAGPKLRAGFVLVPDIGASRQTITAYRNGNIAGVNGRTFRNPRNRHRPVTIVKVVIASHMNTLPREYPAPGTVAPKTTLRPIGPQASSGRQPRTAPANWART